MLLCSPAGRCCRTISHFSHSCWTVVASSTSWRPSLPHHQHQNVAQALAGENAEQQLAVMVTTTKITTITTVDTYTFSLFFSTILRRASLSGMFTNQQTKCTTENTSSCRSLTHVTHTHTHHDTKCKHANNKEGLSWKFWSLGKGEGYNEYNDPGVRMHIFNGPESSPGPSSDPDASICSSLALP